MNRRIFVSLWMLLLPLMPATAQGYRFTRVVGPASEYSFSAPRSVAVDQLGSFYVADTGNHRIQKFRQDGAFIASWGGYGAGDGQFNYPWGVAVDALGCVYVTDTGNSRIQKFSPGGLFLAQWGSNGDGDGQISSPRGIALDSAGNIYVADSFNNRVVKFGPTGVFLGWWGKGSSTGWHSPGSGQTPSDGTSDGQFRFPSGVAVDNSRGVYVIDSRNHRVQFFNFTGSFLAKWGQWGSADGQFADPTGIAVDSLGSIYVADTANSRVQQFGWNRALIRKWGSSGTLDGMLCEPDGIAVSPQGEVYVADCGNKRVQKFDPTGVFAAKWGSWGTGPGPFDQPGGVAMDSSGNVFILDTAGSRVLKYSPNGTLLSEWGSYGSGNAQFVLPQGIAVDSAGSVFVTDTGNRRVQKLTGAGTYVSQWTSAELHDPTAIAVGPSGMVYVADTLATPTAGGEGGWIYGYAQRIVVFNSNGSLFATVTIAGTNGGSLPPALAVDSSGNLFAADPNTNRVLRYSASGSYMAEWGTGGSTNGLLDSPRGIAIDGSGWVYIADFGNDQVQKYTRTGTFIAAWGGPGTGDGQFSGPSSLAVGTSGDVCVADANRVQLFSPSQTLSPAWQLDVGVSVLSGVSTLGSSACFGAEDGQLRCVNALTHTIAWSFDTRTHGAGSTAAIRCRPAVYGAPGAERIYFSTTDGHLFCITNSGALVWQQAASVTPDSTPAVTDGRVYVGTYSGVASFSISDGAPIAVSPQFGGIIRSSPSIPQTDLVWVGCENGRLYCLDSSLALVRAAIGLGEPILAPPTVDPLSSRLFTGWTDGVFTCANAATLGTYWTSRLDGAISSCAYPGLGRIWCGSSLGTLYSFSTTSSVPLSSFASAGSINSPPVVVGDWVYFGTENGSFHAVNANNPSAPLVFESPGCSFRSSSAVCNLNGASVIIAAATNGSLFAFTLR